MAANRLAMPRPQSVYASVMRNYDKASAKNANAASQPDLASAPTEDSYGFFGTIRLNEKLDEAAGAQAWADAFAVFRTAPWEPSDIAIRNFLRGRAGRHFADETSFFAGSLTDRIQQAAGADWVMQEFARMHRDGLTTELFEDDQLA